MSTHQDKVGFKTMIYSIYNKFLFLLMVWYTNGYLSGELWKLIVDIHVLATGCLLPYIQWENIYIKENEQMPPETGA